MNISADSTCHNVLEGHEDTKDYKPNWKLETEDEKKRFFIQRKRTLDSDKTDDYWLYKTESKTHTVGMYGINFIYLSP